MQSLTDGPRAGYTSAQVQYLVENTSSLDTGFGVQLIDMNLDVIADISDEVSTAVVRRNSYAEAHASADFAMSAPLDWGNSLVRPYMTFTGPTSATATELTTMSFYLGAFLVEEQEADLSEVPPTYAVNGIDILSLLQDPIGDDYSIDKGVVYLTRVEEILTALGITRYHIDQDAAGQTLPSPKTYTMEENPTWLQVVNDLLSAVGYAGVWSDHNGLLQCRTYMTPTERSPEWYMTADVSNTLLTQRRRRRRDMSRAYNRWVFYQANLTETQPVDGLGRYEYTNLNVGPTSVEARNGRTVTAPPQALDVATPVHLYLYAQRIIDADMHIPTKFAIETAPFPLAWHFDKFAVNDPVLGADLTVLATDWTLNLDGSDMVWDWTVIS